jgi:hypothetical protein
MGPTTDEERRIRSYLTAQGGKLSPAEIVDKVRGAMVDLRRAALAVPAARFAERPGPDEWSGNEVMAHVAQAGAHFGGRILAALDGRPDPPTPDRDTPDSRRLAAEAWCALLEQDRAALFARALAADPRAGLDRPIAHPMFGPLDWRQTLLFMRLHDLDHAGQLQKIAAALR